MRLEIRYLNEFTYAEPARESHNLLRACPANTPDQRLIHYDVEVDPNARIMSYVDYWGTRVDEFGIREPHMVLSIRAQSTVETSAPVAPEVAPPMDSYGAVRGELVSFLMPSPHVRWNGAVSDIAGASIAGAPDAVGAAVAIADTVTATLEYRPGSTEVGVDVADILEQRTGVCQDFAHLAIAMYRSVGMPARYVSGYLYATRQTDAAAPVDAEVDVQTHAWVEVFIPGHGWWQLDPTNPQPVGELHVKIGHGRDYDDVMPLRGVYHGGSAHDLGVQVTITREQLRQAQSSEQ
jgi:transglutaminase-like putative cysteine protease